jgi:hypothetical protein
MRVTAGSDNFPHRKAKREIRALRNERELSSQTFAFDRPKIEAINRDLAGTQLLKSGACAQQRTFAGTVRTDYRGQYSSVEPQ